jgi:hypothetical protein
MIVIHQWFSNDCCHKSTFASSKQSKCLLSTVFAAFFSLTKAQKIAEQTARLRRPVLAPFMAMAIMLLYGYYMVIIWLNKSYIYIHNVWWSIMNQHPSSIIIVILNWSKTMKNLLWLSHIKQRFPPSCLKLSVAGFSQFIGLNWPCGRHALAALKKDHEQHEAMSLL